MNGRVVVVRSPLPLPVAIANLQAALSPLPRVTWPWTSRVVHGYATPERVAISLGRGVRSGSPRWLVGQVRPTAGGGCQFRGTLTIRYSWPHILVGLVAMALFATACQPFVRNSLLSPERGG